MNISSSLKLFSFLNLFKLCLLSGIILFAGIGLAPDEAQYWTWSRLLDWGYYSKPPGIAAQIWLGTRLFDHTEWGVRAVSVLISLAQGFAIYWLALKSKLTSRAAFWCATLFAFSPIGIIGGVLATTDGGFLLCWTLACGVLLSCEDAEDGRMPLLFGLCIFFGALFKWPIYLLWIPFLLMRQKYFAKQPLVYAIGGIVISLCGLLPGIFWNLTHDWATFRHVGTILQGGHGAVQSNFFEFLGMQFFLFSPVSFGFLLYYFYSIRNMSRGLSRPQIFNTWLTFCLLLGMVVLACFQKVQGNWALFIYPTAAILVGGWICEGSERSVRLKQWAVGISLVLSLAGLFFVKKLPTKQNPLKHNLGWEEVSGVLKSSGYDPEKDFLLSDKYQTTSILSFYGEGKKRAYFINLQGVRRNRFSYWPSYRQEQFGRTGYFIWIENQPHLERIEAAQLNFYRAELPKYFKNVEFLGLFPLIGSKDNASKAMAIFRCQGCTDVSPEESDRY